MKKLNITLLLTAAFFILAGCVAQKKKEDVGAIGKGFHNMTARYNGYYNADLLLKEARMELDEQHTDNFHRILPVYKYVEADNPKAEAEKLDKAVEKVSVVVNLHRVSRWTDDCYLVVGQAQYLKQDYESAEETLEFMVGEFDPREVEKQEAKLKAKKNRKKSAKKGKSVDKKSDSTKADKRNDDEEDEVVLSKKDKEKLAKQKKKEREQEKKRRIKEAEKNRKARAKGKSVPRTKPIEEKPAETPQPDKVTEKKSKKEKEAEEKLAEDAPPAPGSISLGGLEPAVAESDPESYFMKHRPAYQMGVLWLARTYIERESYTNAERLLSQLERSPSTFKDVRQEAATAKAHFYLKQKMYERAVEPLQTAVELSEDKKTKARLSFILGQLHQDAGRANEAYAAFEEVLKQQPDYEMEFSARLNLAVAGVNAEGAVKQLERMLKEDKNKDFRDQIYYALAQIALKKGDKKEGIKNLQLSLNASSANVSQKAEAYLQLADLYFEDENFVKAKLYFDSTLVVMTDADDRYNRVVLLANNLDGIAQNIQIIHLQDSLLNISRMTNDERRDLAAKIQKEENEKKLADLKRQAQDAFNKPVAPKGGMIPGGNPLPPSGGGGGNASKFFAYDDREVKKGVREFERKWGSRQLSDNWRRSDQQSGTSGGDIAGADERQDDGALTPEEIDKIFKDVPDTPEKVNAANRQIEGAYFGLGGLFRDRLENNPKSAESFEELLRRYPETQYQLDAMYYLYVAYKAMNESAKAQVYRDKIVTGYPSSHYAKLITDPNYLKSLAEKEENLVGYYDATYAAFERRQYQEVSERISKVGNMFGGDNTMQPRFALLNAMTVGNLQGKEAYVEALKEVVGKHNDAPEATRAKEILRLLGEDIRTGPGLQGDLPPGFGESDGPYKMDGEPLHYVIVVFSKDINLNDAKVAITQYNDKYHSLQKLRMNNIYLGDGDNKLPLIAIRRYKDKAEAMDYYDGIDKNRQDFLDAGKFEYEVFPISQDNYRELLKAKNVGDYRAFFETNYQD